MEGKRAKTVRIHLLELKIEAYNRIIKDGLRLSEAKKLPMNKRENREVVRILEFLQLKRKPEDPHVVSRAIFLRNHVISLLDMENDYH
jgi:hypothetical protein